MNTENKNFFIAAVICIVYVFVVMADYSKACSMPGNNKHEIDPDEALLDSEPPGKIEIINSLILRGHEPDGIGCSSGGSCDDIGSITIGVTPPEDNRTDAEHMGYRLEMVGGNPPIQLPDFDVTSPFGEIYIHWGDGATDSQEAIEFSVIIYAIDLAGNVGPPSEPYLILHPGSSGCNTNPRSSLSTCFLALVFYAIFRRNY